MTDSVLRETDAEAFTYRMIDGPPQTPGWPTRRPELLENPEAQLVRRLRSRIRYGGRKGRRAARRLAKIRDGLFG
jgi:hypothetical protein